MEPEDDVGQLTAEQTTEALVKAWAAHEKLLDMVEDAWGIIADARSSVLGWQGRVIQWREEFAEILRENTLPEED